MGMETPVEPLVTTHEEAASGLSRSCPAEPVGMSMQTTLQALRHLVRETEAALTALRSEIELWEQQQVLSQQAYREAGAIRLDGYEMAREIIARAEGRAAEVERQADLQAQERELAALTRTREIARMLKTQAEQHLGVRQQTDTVGADVSSSEQPLATEWHGTSVPLGWTVIDRPAPPSPSPTDPSPLVRRIEDASSTQEVNPGADGDHARRAGPHEKVAALRATLALLKGQR